MRSLLRAALVCVSGLASAAQAPPAAKTPPPGVLHSVTINGNQRYAAADIVQQSGLVAGQHITPADVETARLKLQSLELFDKVSDRYNWSASRPPAYDVIFDVSEVQQVFPMRFDRLTSSGDKLQSCLQTHVPLYSDEIPGTEGVLQRYTRAIHECLPEGGSKFKITAKVSNEDPKQLAVIFAPDTPPPNISEVHVTGNQAVDTGTILRAVNPVAIGAPLSDMRLKQILDGSIKPVYAARGLVAVSFPKIEAVPSKTNLGVILSIEIKEGPLFKFGAIRFHGSGMDPDQVKSNIVFHPGQSFNGRAVDDFRIWLAHNLRQQGHLDASVTFETQEDDASRSVAVTYTVVPGPIYTFASLDIQGLDLTSSPAVEELWGEKPGKPFNPDYPDFFLKRVEERKMFDNLAQTTSDYTADPASHSVIVHLYFKGGKSPAQRAREAEEEKQKRTSDGTWSPWFRARR